VRRLRRHNLDYEQVSAYNSYVRRKPGALVPLEVAICVAAADLDAEFHGYELAKHLAGVTGQRSLAAYGTLYRALARLEQMNLVKSRWEDPEIPARENRPGRRLYTLTALGQEAAEAARPVERAKARKRPRRKLVPA
jgi:PadR family transcriptional regulator PadR